ncbi:pyridoxal phosphate-dependent aminotransferase [Helicobacter sp. 11S03491-1]|uniref:pyridoxal phosphate-dependent aminotransferase n=1 Tax=Helicobacter sp. 11S03491-1 TaxID=1476196 RepID=UPI000BA542A7|nr:pyridoxal phosphate-dependent aminotransferase [Helicobacter sp. 11S03491-1]PAF42225.1 aspartate aminotransferase [Helicobacter sp. 11S03491-1]
MYSQKIQNLSESATIAMSRLAGELKAKGRDVLSFSAGEPDFDTPQVIKDEAIRALNSGWTKYTPVAGIPELLQAISYKLQKDNKLSYTPKEILVSNGAKQSLFNAFQALIEEGDEVIIPSPYWVTYPELVIYSGGKPVFLPTNENTDFKITSKQLKEAVTPKTKILVLTTPSNPTGMVYSKNELTQIAEVLKGTNIWVVSDEMYEKLIYGVDFTSSASISEDMMQRTITVNGLSKSVAMTGWRMGYLATKDLKLIKLIDNLQSQCTSNINSITQRASIVALNGEADSDIEMMREAFEKRRNLACQLIEEISGMSALKPQGAFYLFINIKNIHKFNGDSMKFCEQLLSQEGVALVPGSAFGMDGYVRFSFACSNEQIIEGFKRITKFINS